jgi:WD40 repeat protein
MESQKYGTISAALVLYEWSDSDPATCVDFSPSGRTVASGSEGGKASVTEFTKGKTTELSSDSGVRIDAVAFSPKDTNILASPSHSGVLQVWDVEQRHALFTLGDPEASQHVSFAFSPDGEFAAVACGGFSGPAVNRLLGIERVSRGPNCSATSPESRVSPSPSTGKPLHPVGAGTAMFWDAATGKTQHECTFHGSDIVFCPPKGELVTLSGEDKIELRNTKTWERVGLYHSSTDNYRLACSRDGTLLAAGCGDDVIRLWDISRPQVFEQRPPGVLESATLLPGRCDRCLIHDSEGGRRIWDVKAIALGPAFPSVP